MEEKTYQYTTKDNLIYILSGAAKWRMVVVICTITFAICEGLKNYVWLYASKLIIQVFEFQNEQTDRYQSIVQIVILAAIIFIILALGYEISEKTASSRITDVRTNFVLLTNRKMMNMPYELLEQPQVLDLKRKSDRATADMIHGIEGMLRNVAKLGARFVMVITAAIILINFNLLLVVIMLGLAALRAFLLDLMAKWEKEEFYDGLVSKWREEHYYFKTAMSSEYAKDIRIYKIQDPILEKQAKVFDCIMQKVRELNNKKIVTYTRDHLLELLQEGIMYIWLVFGVMQHDISVADFTLYVGSIRTFNIAVQKFLEILGDIRRDSRLISDFRYFIDYEVINQKSSFKKDYLACYGKKEKTGIEITDEIKSKLEIRFEHVSFQYIGSDKFALKDLSLSIEPGEKLAVVGLNGAGKSTFIKLLCRLYEPTEGTIYLNGVDIKEYDKNEYFDLISPVFQNVECFAFPLAENISMKVPEETNREKVLKCIEKSGLKVKVDSLEKGVDTEILKFLHPDGIELSGGQKQKMALARALYKESSIVVLDEPTAALDAIAEYETYQNFNDLIGSRIAVYISHRLSSTRFCDHVAMFEHGEMIEYGTHDGLLEKGGSYATMFEVQAQYYKEGGATA